MRLDAHVADDHAALAALWADPRVVGHILPAPSSAQDSWFRLLRYRGFWPVLGYGYWAIRMRDDGRYVGDIGFADHRRDVAAAFAAMPEAGWVLDAAFHGRGLAAEALAAVLGWLDARDEHRRVFCQIARGNAPSLRLAERAGFARHTAVGDNVLLVRAT